MVLFRGNFDASCRPCEMSDTSESGSDTSDDVILQCDCADSSGIPKYTTLTLGPDGMLLHPRRERESGVTTNESA